MGHYFILLSRNGLRRKSRSKDELLKIADKLLSKEGSEISIARYEDLDVK